MGGRTRHGGAARADGIYRYGSRRNADRRVRPDRNDGDHLQLSLLSEANGTYGIYERPGLARVQDLYTGRSAGKTFAYR